MGTLPEVLTRKRPQQSCSVLGMGNTESGTPSRCQMVTPDSSTTVSRAKGADSAGALQQKGTSYQKQLNCCDLDFPKLCSEGWEGLVSQHGSETKSSRG